jgi:RimJ/RimL family protein N-acetyltransferase
VDAADRPTLRGPRVTLRAPAPGDVADRLAAGRDPEFRRMVGAVGPAPGPMYARDARRWHDALRADRFGWAVEHEGRCVGEARLHGLDAAGGEAWLAVGLFAPEHRGRGLGTEAVGLLLAHAFGTLALRAVRVRVLAFNARAIACYRRCGFVEVGREPVDLGGEVAEDVLMVAAPPAGGDSCSG